MPPRFAHSPTTNPRSACWALLVIDQRPLRRAAWAAFHQASKLQEKAARDLHRHEQVDTPDFERWLHTAFPTLITTLRELHAQVDALSREVNTVQYMASLTGRSLKKLWREHKEYMADPEAFDRKQAAKEAAHNSSFFDDGDDAEFENLFEDLFGNAQDPAFDRKAEGARSDSYESSDHDFFGHSPRVPRPADPADETRDLYRRLVQRLHPDRGGEWTPARERLWHEVQQAWEARDTDWLARLDIEWETAHHVINENSSLDRLRRAVVELHAARRDTERKLRVYRKTSAWRFTLSEKKRTQLHRLTKSELSHDIDTLQRQLDYLQATIASWEQARPSRRKR